MECVPGVRVETDRLAAPPLRVPVPRGVDPSRNCTVPVAVAGVTVAVNRTGCCALEGFTEEVSATAEPARTVCVSGAEVLAAAAPSPPYTAVMECAPAVRVGIVSAAVAAL